MDLGLMKLTSETKSFDHKLQLFMNFQISLFLKKDNSLFLLQCDAIRWEQFEN